MTHAFALLEQAEPIVRAYAHIYARRFRGIRKEDIAQEGRKIALEELRAYDPERGVTFMTFCYRRDVGGMLDYAKKEANAGTAAFVAAIALRDETAEPETFTLSDVPHEQALVEDLQGRVAAFLAATTLDGQSASAEEAYDAAARRQQVRVAVAALAPEEARFVAMFYEEGLRIDQIAPALGISARTAKRLHQRVKEQLAERLVDPTP